MPRKAPSDDATGLCQELQRLGLGPDQAAPLAARLVEVLRGEPEREMQGLLDAAGDTARTGTTTAPELSRILEDFAVELKKLDEGLRLLAAYLTRLRGRTGERPAPTLH